MVSGLVRLRIWLGRGFHTTSAAHTPRSCSTLTSCPGKATPSTGPAAVAEAAAASRPIGCALVVYPPCTASVKFGSLITSGTLWSPSDRGAWMALVCSRKAEARRMHCYLIRRSALTESAVFLTHERPSHNGNCAVLLLRPLSPLCIVESR